MSELRVNGKTYKLILPWLILRPLEEIYLNNDCTIVYDDGTWRDVKYTQTCDLCHEPAKVAVCKTNSLNKQHGYPLRICPCCQYYYMVQNGYPIEKVPKSIRKQI